MRSVRRLLRAELLGLRTSSHAGPLLAATAILTLAIVALTLSRLDGDELAAARGVREVLTIGAGVASVIALAAGIVGVTAEYRHGTIGQALLSAPARWPVVVAKALAYALAGLALGVVALAATFAAGVPGLAGEDAGVSYSSALVRYAIAGTLLAPALFGAIGVGLGMLVRDQRYALAAGPGWLLVVDNVAMSAAPAVAKFLPGGALTSLVRGQTQDVVPAGVAALLLVAYALAFAAAGALALRRRDLTSRAAGRPAARAVRAHSRHE